MNDQWIALDLIPHVGPRTIARLLAVFGTPEHILRASRSELSRLGFLKSPQLEALARGADRDAVARVKESLQKTGAHVLSLTDPDYPPLLKEIPDPPTVLYVQGTLAECDPAVALVGTRAPSHHGREMAGRLAQDLSAAGISVISGLARGIDTISHQGALRGISPTVAVLGSGLDVIYPPENAGLAGEIAGHGAVISEFSPGTPPDARHFPRRNRIISGLSRGVVVVEATEQSGAMITARLAGEQGRLLMAVPGQTTNIRTCGPHQLIREGAVLVRNSEDIIAEIAPQVEVLLRNVSSGEEKDSILELLAGAPLTMDELVHASGEDVSVVARRLSALELDGRITRIAGNRYTARSSDG